MMHANNDPLREKLDTQEVLINKLQAEIAYLKKKLNMFLDMIALQKNSAPFEHSTLSAPLHLLYPLQIFPILLLLLLIILKIITQIILSIFF